MSQSAHSTKTQNVDVPATDSRHGESASIAHSESLAEEFASKKGIGRPAESIGWPKSWAGRILKWSLTRFGDLPIQLKLPNGDIIQPDRTESIGTIEIFDNSTVWALALNPSYQFGESYSNGRLEIHGDIEACLTAVYRVMNQNAGPPVGKRLMDRFHRPRQNSLNESKQNVHHHYDLGNEFYRLWLDERMVYTCAYFAEPKFTLEQAQIAKLDHVCRKLRLRPGMQVVEAGCGWGALAIHMAKHYGVNVRAYNISNEQVAWARELADEAGLAGRVEFLEEDWRNIRGRYDAFVSIGMLEHVGVKNYELLGRKIRDCLSPIGIGLIHTIGQNQSLPFNTWIERRIFPGAYPPTLGQMMDVLEPSRFSVLDVENLRLHYAQTLRHWLARFESNVEEIRSRFDERFVRMWRMYLAGSIASFETGWLQLFQVVFANATSNHVPRTRNHIYESSRYLTESNVGGNSQTETSWIEA